jgi:ribosome-binding factor A
VKDPRIGFVTVIRAELHHSTSTAEVFVTVFEDDKKKDTVKALNKMKGFFQKDLSKTLGTRLTPVLTFKLDEAADKAYGLDSLISKARQSDADHLNAPEDSELEGSSEGSLEENQIGDNNEENANPSDDPKK